MRQGSIWGGAYAGEARMTILRKHSGHGAQHEAFYDAT